MSNIDRTVSYIAGAGQTVFDVPFDVFLAGDLFVYLRPVGSGDYIQLTPSDFVFDSEFATVTLNGSSAAGDGVIIQSIIGSLRPYTFAASVPATSKALNLEADYLNAGILDLRRDIGRAMVAPPGQVPFDMPYGQDPTGKVLIGVSSTEFALIDGNSVIQMTGAADVFANLALLRIVSDGTVVRAILLGRVDLNDGGQGEFIWSGADLSAEVLADPLMGIYVPRSGEDGTDGAWVRQISQELIPPEWWGASPDCNMQNGTGSDSFAALTAMIAYCETNQRDGILSGYYYSGGQVTINSCRVRGIGRHLCGLYVYHGNTERSVHLTASNAGIGPCEVKAHLNESKGSDSGHLGTCVTVGEYLKNAAQEKIHGIFIDVKATRQNSAGGAEGTPAYSFPSPAVCLFGNMRGGTVIVEPIGGDVTKHSIGFQAHWGAHTPDINTIPTMTYHVEGVAVEIVDPKNCKSVCVLSATIDMRVKSFKTVGAQRSFLHLVGDNTNVYAGEDQKSRVGRGNIIGDITVLDADNTDAYIQESVKVAGYGTSKAETHAGGVIALVNQVEVDLKIGRIVAIGDAASKQAKACFIIGVTGTVDIESVYCKNYSTSSLEIQNCKGGIIASVVGGSDAPVKAEFSKDINLIGTAVKIAEINDDNPCISITGDNSRETTTLAANAIRGDTTITLASGLTNKIFTGDELVIGTETVRATAMAYQGVTEIEVTEIITTQVSGASVVLRQICDLSAYVNCEGGEYGMNVTHAYVTITGTGPRGCGRVGYKLRRGAIVMQTGASPINNGQARTLNAAYNSYDWVIDAGANLTIQPGLLGYATENVTKHFDVNRNGEEDRGRLTVVGATVQDSTKLGTSSSTNDYELIGVTDINGDAITSF